MSCNNYFCPTILHSRAQSQAVYQSITHLTVFLIRGGLDLRDLLLRRRRVLQELDLLFVALDLRRLLLDDRLQLLQTLGLKSGPSLEQPAIVPNLRLK